MSKFFSSDSQAQRSAPMASAAVAETAQKIISRYELDPNLYQKKLENFYGTEVVIICDDSGSMRNTMESGQTRWEELKKIVKVITNVAVEFDKDGVDIYFLNRQFRDSSGQISTRLRNITNFKSIDEAFTPPPDGYTPLTTVFKQVLKDKADILSTKKVLIFIATDGVPSDNNETDFKNAIISRNKYTNVSVTLLACTDDLGAVDYMNEWDKELPRVDVVDDYESEKKEVFKAWEEKKKKQGIYTNEKRKFTFNEYVIKTLLGSSDPGMDNLDE